MISLVEYWVTRWITTEAPSIVPQAQGGKDIHAWPWSNLRCKPGGMHASKIDSPPHVGYDVGDYASSYLPANTGSRCGLGCILAREYVNLTVSRREARASGA